MSTVPGSEGLKRVVGIFALAATVVNFSIGAGIYALPGTIGLDLGAAAIIGYVLCAIVFGAIILCYLEIGTRIKSSGGSYAYVESAFGPFAGFIVNWLFFFGWGILSDAAVMNIVCDSLGIVFPIFATPYMRVVLLAVLLGAMILTNVLDTKKSIRVVEIITMIKLLPLVAIIVFGLSHIHWDNLRIDHLPPFRSFENTALVLFFAFAGFESSLGVSGEIRNPERTIPRGVALGGLIVLVIYLLIQVVAQGVLGPQLALNKDAPLAAIAQSIAGPIGATVLLFAAVVSGIGCVNGDVLASSRLLFAGAKDGLFPGFLGKVHPKFVTPYWAIIVYGMLIFFFSVSGGFKQLAVLATGALLLIYIAVILALLKLRKEGTAQARKGFRVPGGPVIPVIAILVIIWVLSNLSKRELISLAIFVTAVSLAYFLMKKWKERSHHFQEKDLQAGITPPGK